jgi:4-hydroxybenzoate polyprenyltransferase
VFWTLAYDTQYAMVDRDDDKRIGIKTSAMLFGRMDVALVMLFHAAFIGGMGYVGVRANLGLAYFIAIALAAALAACQYPMIRTRTREGCFKAFMHNNWIGAVIFCGIVADFLLRIPAPWMRHG